MPSSRKSRKHAKLGSNADSQSFRVGAVNDFPKRRIVKGNGQMAASKVAKPMIERLDEQPESDFIPLTFKEAKRLQGIPGNGVAVLAKHVNRVLERRRPRQKVAAYNAGAEKIEAIGKVRHPVRYKKRVKDEFVDTLELDSLRRVRVRK